jgi:hypothetical protein
VHTHNTSVFLRPSLRHGLRSLRQLENPGSLMFQFGYEVKTCQTRRKMRQLRRLTGRHSFPTNLGEAIANLTSLLQGAPTGPAGRQHTSSGRTRGRRFSNAGRSEPNSSRDFILSASGHGQRDVQHGTQHFQASKGGSPKVLAAFTNRKIQEPTDGLGFWRYLQKTAFCFCSGSHVLLRLLID